LIAFTGSCEWLCKVSRFKTGTHETESSFYETESKQSGIRIWPS